MRSIVAGLAVLVGLSGTAMADIITSTPAGFAGAFTTDMITGQVTHTSGGTRASTIVYDNTASAANAGVTNGDNTATWGDTMTTTGTGTLQDFTCSVYNSSTSTGTLASATLAVDFYRTSDNSHIGGFTSSLTFSGMTPGFYTLVSFTNLSTLAIGLDTTGILVTQSLSAVTGGATVTGVVSLNPVTVGSSPVSLYVSDPPGLPAGLYTLGSTPAQVAYQIGVIPAPASMGLLALGGLVATRRRR
jgi:hypothetical protein